MVWVEIYGKRYEGKSPTLLTKRLGKDLILKWYDEFEEKEKCGWCDRPVKQVVKLVPKEDGSDEYVIRNVYKHKACKEEGCPSKTLNPRSKEWLIKSKGMTAEEADEFSSNIGKRSAQTRSIYRKGRNDNPYSKEYWVDRGMTQEEAQSKVNERNRRCKEFWLARGYPEDRACNMALFHKRTMSKEFLMYFKGYSEAGAIEVIKKNSERISATNKGNIASLMALRKGSEAADAFFKNVMGILSTLGVEDDEVYTESFGKGREWYCSVKNEGVYFYDFCIPSLGLVIEYHGTHVHPKSPDDKEWKHAYTNESAREVFEKDERKKNLIFDMFGFGCYYEFYSDDDEEQFLDRLHREVGKSLEVF